MVERSWRGFEQNSFNEGQIGAAAGYKCPAAQRVGGTGPCNSSNSAFAGWACVR